MTEDDRASDAPRCDRCGNPIDFEAFKALGWDDVEVSTLCAPCLQTIVPANDFGGEPD